MSRTISLTEFYHQEKIKVIKEPLTRLQNFYTNQPFEMEALINELFMIEDGLMLIDGHTGRMMKGLDEFHAYFERERAQDWQRVFHLEDALVKYKDDMGWIGLTGELRCSKVSLEMEKPVSPPLPDSFSLLFEGRQQTPKPVAECKPEKTLHFCMSVVLSCQAEHWFIRQIHYSAPYDMAE